VSSEVVFVRLMSTEPRLVFLTGFMAAGKTSVAQALARLLRWQCIDLDERIESDQQCSISEFFRSFGESRFREVECLVLQAVLKGLPADSGTVIALGGGTFMESGNADLLRSARACGVFLDAPVEELWHRSQKYSGARPLAASQNHFRQLYEARRRRYMEAGIHISTSGKSATEAAVEIAAALGLGGKDIGQ
jgi:shikimate kinase